MVYEDGFSADVEGKLDSINGHILVSGCLYFNVFFFLLSLVWNGVAPTKNNAYVFICILLFGSYENVTCKVPTLVAIDHMDCDCFW